MGSLSQDCAFNVAAQRVTKSSPTVCSAKVGWKMDHRVAHSEQSGKAQPALV